MEMLPDILLKPQAEQWVCTLNQQQLCRA